MLQDIVNAFFKDQEDLSSEVGAKRHIMVSYRRLKLQHDSARRQHVAGKSPHTLREIAEMILLGINRPDDIAHSLHQLIGNTTNLRQRLVYLGFAYCDLLLRQLTQ